MSTTDNTDAPKPGSMCAHVPPDRCSGPTDVDLLATDLRSDATTIGALRNGVHIAHRVAVVGVTDEHGDHHMIPLVVQSRGIGTDTVDVATGVLEVADKRTAGPRRRQGSVSLSTLAAFTRYVGRYRTEDMVIFAEPERLIAIFDYHGRHRYDPETLVDVGSRPGWCRDVAVYAMPRSRQWLAWTAAAGKMMSQDTFGDLIEANHDDIVGGDGHAAGPQMLELARNLVVHAASKYERKVDPTTGTGTLISTDEHGPTSTKIPKSFQIAIPAYAASTALYKIECRLRFTLSSGRPVFYFTLHNLDEVAEHAHDAVCSQAEAATGAPVFVGSPPVGG